MTTKKTLFTILLFLFAVTMASGTNSFASDGGIVYIDLERALNESNKGKRAIQELDEESQQISDELQTEEAELLKLRDKIEKNKDIWSKEKSEKSKAEFLTRGKEFQNKVLAAEKDFNKRKQEVEVEIIKELSEIVKDLAKKKGYELVFNNVPGSIIYSAGDRDITEAVIKEYNKRTRAKK
ncbi:MAG: OmpH family outer membrane protein [Deltaproteobacteria bacterium]|nr:OmpH family outer membrane protein [Deltaproteobacteria bacterium]